MGAVGSFVVLPGGAEKTTFKEACDKHGVPGASPGTSLHRFGVWFWQVTRILFLCFFS